MKRIPAILIVLLLIATIFAGCELSKTPAEKSDKISVVTTIFPPYDFTRAIADDKADITMLLPPGSESHTFEPTAKDMTKIQNCDVFIYVGGESDAWVERILDSFEDKSKIKIITLIDCVEAFEEEIVDGMQDVEEDPEEDPEEHEYDEHVWTSPQNAKLIVEKISAALCDVDAKNTALYKQNTKNYLAKLDELDAKFQAVVDKAVRKTLVFGDRFPFRYFTEAYGLTYFAAFPGCASETEASPGTIRFLIDKIKAEKIPVIFHIEMSNEKIAETISEATGTKVRLLHACHNISQADFAAGRTYLEIMTENVDVLKEALW
ncbi:MAG: metal ABC transporter substrate-binding protein [Oscillospiraceae bacterium]|jgi:zinc transport system substrate-binding protein|nr:metal ABC transporter substrate-binding protein [Oscillospiraceae bacterium]